MDEQTHCDYYIMELAWFEPNWHANLKKQACSNLFSKVRVQKRNTSNFSFCTNIPHNVLCTLASWHFAEEYLHNRKLTVWWDPFCKMWIYICCKHALKITMFEYFSVKLRILKIILWKIYFRVMCFGNVHTLYKDVIISSLI